MSRSRWMALCFALGSTCFLIAPFPGYAQLVGDSADAVTFFIGSILFTAGGGLQSWLAWSERHSPGGGGAAWWAAIIQSAGTLFFNVTTYQAMHTALTSPEYNKLVWRPDWRGSICFLVSGAIAYCASARRGWLPVRGDAGWWQPASQPARLRLLRNLRCRRLRRSVDRVDGRPGGGQLEHIAGRDVLPGLCARHLAHRQGLEDATGLATPRARAQARGRRPVGDLRGQERRVATRSRFPSGSSRSHSRPARPSSSTGIPNSCETTSMSLT